MKKKKRSIKDAYDAWWFLYNHPKLNVQERDEVTPEEAADLEAGGSLVARDSGGKCWRVWRHLWRHALDENLDNASKNKWAECWLEFGPIYYGYAYSGGKEPAGDWDTETTLHHSHDPYLDTGGGTFDQGLVRLARNVLRRYGDYSDKLAEEMSGRWCGKPVCGDCEQVREARVRRLRAVPGGQGRAAGC